MSIRNSGLFTDGAHHFDDFIRKKAIFTDGPNTKQAFLSLNIMKDRKYELVAFTRNITAPENTTLHMIPELELELQEPLYEMISKCRKEEKQKNGIVDLSLAQKYIRAYEKCAQLDILFGHPKDGFNFLCRACEYASLHKELSDEYLRLSDLSLTMVKESKNTIY